MCATSAPIDSTAWRILMTSSSSTPTRLSMSASWLTATVSSRVDTAIELIQELQPDGFNLESIRKLLDSAGGSSSEVLNFSRTLRAPFEDEEPEILTEEEFAERWGGPLDPRLMARTEKLGLLRDMGDGRYEILSPRLQRAGLELAELGVRPDVALEVVSQVRTSARRVARVFIELFLENVWKPFN